MDRLNEAELATATGASPLVIGRMIELGVIAPPSEGGFPVPDIARVRLALAMEASGVPLDAIGRAIHSGGLSLGFVDQLLPNPGRLLPKTQDQVVEELGLSPPLAERVRTILGTASLAGDEPIREDDAEILGLVAAASAIGVDDDRLVRTIRAVTDNLRRILETQRDFLDQLLVQPALGSGMSDQEMLDRMAPFRRQFRRMTTRLLELMHERLVDEGLVWVLVEYLEQALTKEGILRPRGEAPPAIAFADLSGYTRLTEEQGDEIAAAHAGRLAELAQQVSERHAGRLVKQLGDGAMLHFGDATSAVRGALTLVDEASVQGLPATRVGIDVGPVVRQDGDYFGSTVNVAARTTDYARPREVLVTTNVRNAWTGGKEVLFHEIGPVPLKNVAEPVELYQAIPAGA
jgi:adenylate cyclase